ncbi:hypothetical protein C4D60_Mb04t16890 [Musa balbisiana]|uniref:C3H1-type domain-containing protein n=1 Tax=Musa balbisiana TaxID=52838 RepID=A0A4S8KCL2_MUSBA|nr:hypothetical protein C4D60_Mb04t16890 [Musa balbisiana]
MIRRKLYKTKLCTLFQRDRCPRHSCNFAHGEAEIRRFGGSFNGRRNHRSGDLRDKLDRRHSPYRRLSKASPNLTEGIPGRDARAHQTFRERRNRKKQHMTRESDVSESSEASDGPEDRKREEKASSYDDKDGLEEQIRQILLDIEMLDDHKSQVEFIERSSAIIWENALANASGDILHHPSRGMVTREEFLSATCLPFTGMASHAEEFIEATEPDEKPETIETRAVFEIDDVDYVTKSTNMPPPPPVMQQTYKQHEGDNEEFDGGKGRP